MVSASKSYQRIIDNIEDLLSELRDLESESKLDREDLINEICDKLRALG